MAQVKSIIKIKIKTKRNTILMIFNIFYLRLSGGTAPVRVAFRFPK